MKRLVPLLVTALVFLATFGATAHAAAALEPADGSLLDLMKPVYEAFTQGHYLFAGAACLTLAVALARRYSPHYLPRLGAWFQTDAGAAVLVLCGSLGAGLTTSWAGGVTPTWQTFSTAFKIAFMAAGGYATLRALVIKPYVEKLADKGPAWLHTPAQLVLWIFQLEAPDRGATPPAPDA